MALTLQCGGCPSTGQRAENRQAELLLMSRQLNLMRSVIGNKAAFVQEVPSGTLGGGELIIGERLPENMGFLLLLL